jgi:hypothetical protein
MGKRQNSKSAREAAQIGKGVKRTHKYISTGTTPEASPNVKAEEEYRSFGDRIPPVDRLKLYKDALHTSSKPPQGVLLADVCIDLAIAEPKNAVTHLTDAADALDYTLRAAKNVLQTLSVAPTRVAPVAALAIMRRAELPQWEAAAGVSDFPVPNPYNEMLLASREACSIPADTPQCRAIVAESLPVLLGQRAAERGLDIAWSGRMALTREDKRVDSEAGNPNWDCGITFSTDVADFVSPSLKLQIKRGSLRSSSAYAQRGVLALSAEQYGFRDTHAVIQSCLVEAGYLSSASMSGTLMSSDQLDTVTGSLHEAMQEFQH